LPARCARAADGHVAAPPSSVMNSRRLLLTWVCLLRQSATTKPAHSAYHVLGVPPKHP
jgi:hypothetical protein